MNSCGFRQYNEMTPRSIYDDKYLCKKNMFYVMLISFDDLDIPRPPCCSCIFEMVAVMAFMRVAVNASLQI